MRFTPRHDFFSLDAGALKRTLLGEGFARDAAFCGIPLDAFVGVWGSGGVAPKALDHRIG